MTIRVCLIIPTLDRGGAEKQLCLLAAGLPRDRFDVHVVVLTRDGPLRSMLDQADIPVTRIGKRFKADPTAYFRLKRTLATLRPDLVHTWIFAANSYGRAAARSVGVRRVLGSERCVDFWKTAGHFAVDRYLAGRSDAITTNSEGVRQFYARHGIDPELFCVIPNGIPPATAPTLQRDEALRRLGVDGGRRLIAAVGRLWPQKRYRDLIWAAEMLDTLRGDTTLVIIGDGPQRDELIRHRDQASNADRVRFVGHRDDVPSLLPHFDLFWIGSQCEGQSNGVLEAMQAGLPVIASDIPGNRDLVVDGQTGLLVPLGDSAAMTGRSNDLLDDPDQASAMGRAGRQRIAQQFTVQQMVQRHAELYQRLCD